MDLMEIPGTRKTYVTEKNEIYYALVECEDVDEKGNLRYYVVRDVNPDGSDRETSWVIDEWVTLEDGVSRIAIESA